MWRGKHLGAIHKEAFLCMYVLAYHGTQAPPTFCCRIAEPSTPNKGAIPWGG